MIAEQQSIILDIFLPIAEYAGVFLGIYIVYMYLDDLIHFLKLILSAFNIWK